MPNHTAQQSSDLTHAARTRLDVALHRAMSTQIEHWLSAESAATATPIHRYALVSAGQCEEGVVARMVAMQELACERLFMQTPEAEMADIGPWLIEIPASSSESLRHALAHQAAAEALTLMASPLRLQKLSAHLRGFLSGTLPDGSSVLLRYFDPRIGFDIFAHWSDPVQRKFSRPLAWWAGWDGDLRIRYIKGSADTEITPSNEGVELTAEWVQAIDKAGEANLVIALLCEELETSNPPAADLLAQMHPLLRRKIAQAALAFARHAGLAGWDNKAHACRLALLKHARFHTHPGFLDALSVARTPLNLRDVLAHTPSAVQQGWACDRDAMLVRLCDEQSNALLSAFNTTGGGFMSDAKTF
ncbi:DUF4123 domain-containing protein [Variovorax sp. V118]|uniref:DUF4123 domain-containing protein n=1 Tax=Variovorax sp. V118 TaxID=3065954 RepID=UPI0034E86086